MTESSPGPEPQGPPQVAQVAAAQAPTPMGAAEAADGHASSASPPPASPPTDTQMPDLELGWSADLVGSFEHFDARRVAGRAAAGVGLSALYGLALGTRDGGWALVTNALSVPMALIVVCAVGIPALFIAFAFLDAPIEPKGMAMVASRSLATAGMVLAGLAPAAALFIVTTEGRLTAVLVGAVGLLAGAAFGLRSLLFDVLRRLVRARVATQLAAIVACGLFGLFAIMLSARVIQSMGSLLSLLAVIEGGV